MDGISFRPQAVDHTTNYDFIRNVHLGDILRPSLSGAALTLPIDQGLPTTHFKYVSGVPGSEPGSGYPVSKLQALDALIDSLVAMGKQEPDSLSITKLGYSDEALDAMIEQMSQKLAGAMTQGIPGLIANHGIQMGTALSHTGIVLNSLA